MAGIQYWGCAELWQMIYFILFIISKTVYARLPTFSDSWPCPNPLWKVFFPLSFLIFMSCSHGSYLISLVGLSNTTLDKSNENTNPCFVPECKRIHSVFSIKYNFSFSTFFLINVLNHVKEVLFSFWYINNWEFHL